MALSRSATAQFVFRRYYLRGYRCTLESGLPLRIDNVANRSIGSCEGIAKVFTELRDSNDHTSCLVLKADQQDDPNSIHAPEASPRILAEGCKFPNLIVF